MTREDRRRGHAGAGSFLERMAASSAARVAEAQDRVPRADLERRAARQAPPPALRFSSAGFDVIAEVKWRSPAEGSFSGVEEDTATQTRAVATRASDYARAGAVALSVLTEPTEFHGSLEHLSAACRAAADVPVMRKDFLVDPYQVLEARAAGAGGVLLIVRMLTDEALEQMALLAGSLDMFVLLEAFDEPDLRRVDAWTGHPNVLVGLNCRDLRTLEVRPERFQELADAFPAGVPRVAESGLSTPADAARVAGAGYSVGLVGSALMRASDPGYALRALLEAGREVACASG